MKWIGFIGVCLVSFLGCSSIGYVVGQSELVNICVRTVDEEDSLRGRQATYNRRGARLLLRDSPFSFRGICVAEAQGVQRRVKVCLVASSKCYHDRTTGIWPDEIKKYFERYPGSYKGACKEGTEHEDTCGQAHLFRMPERFVLGCLQYDRMCKQN